MINQTLLWLLLLPVLLGVGVWAARREPGSMPLCAMFAVAAALLTAGMFFAGKGAKTSDVEIINGEVTGKTRDHGHYLKPYECMCTYDDKGNKTCQTCHEDRYTVDWDVQTTVGEVGIDYEDWGSRQVYSLPDPAFFSAARPGDPASLRHGYTNYVQAVPESLFTPSSESVRQKFARLVPAYPDAVRDHYYVDRVLSPGLSLPDAARWNLDLANALRKLGPSKQVNLIVVVAATDDPSYEYALRDAWDNANKNDVVLVVGAPQYPKISFVRVISWTRSEIFKVELRDAVQAMGVLDRERLFPLVQAQVEKNFVRRRMREFEYLDAEIDPPEWLMWLAVALQAAGAVALWAWAIPRYGSRWAR